MVVLLVVVVDKKEKVWEEGRREKWRDYMTGNKKIENI